MNGRVHRVLRLQHHRHTAKRLPHHHTSYRGVWLLLALMALCIGAIERASADNYNVTATVPSAVLDRAAVIVTPPDAITVNDPQIIITGTCQVTIAGTIVALERDESLLGSAMCASNGTFSIPVTLIEGQNVILPTVTTTDNTTGPDGQTISITYEYIAPLPTDAPATTTPSSPQIGTSNTRGRTSSPVALKVNTEQPFATYTEDGIAVLSLAIEGGTAPYTMIVDWGDGQVDSPYVLKRSGIVQLRHTYDTPNAYAITARITDAAGQEVVYQIPAVKIGSLATTYSTPVVPTIGSLSLTPSFTRLVWGAYFSISLGIVALWVAEHTALLPKSLVFVKWRR